jgi:hypothetical protein
MKIMKIIYILRPALAALLLLAAGAEAAVPRLINFQGKLSDSGGGAVTSPVSMVYKIYTAASGGAPVWTETQTVTPDASGVYSVMLGTATPLDISFSIPYWLGVTVGADSEMLPRYRMASSPYALNSSTAAWAEGADWPTITNKPDLTIQGNVFNGVSQLVQLLADGKLPVLDGSNLTGLPTAFLADGAVTTAKLADGAVTTTKLADGGVTDAKVTLSAAAITSGKFGDSRVAISTQALSGGIYNLAGRLVQMGADGFLPALNGVNLTGLTKAQVGLGSVDNTSDAAKPVSTAQQTALNLKASLAGAVFTGAISAPNLSGTNTGDETAVSIKTALGAATALADGYLTAADWTAFNDKLDPDGNGSALTGLTKAQVGLANVNNTSDLAKPVSTAQQAALDLKADLAGAAFTGAISATNLSGTNTGNETAATIKTKLGAATALADGYLTSVDWAAFNGKLSPTGSGALLTGITAAQVGLGSVDNTSDAAKPVSTLQQAALDLKADLTGAAFTGAISAPNLSGANTGDQVNITGNAATVTTNADLTGVVTSDGNVTSIAGGVITNAMLANGAVANLSGTNTGDQLNITGNAGTVTNGVYTTGDQTIGGIKTFSSPIVGSITGNAATVTTNANLTGVVTSVGNVTSIAAGAITNTMLANGAVANLSGINTGDQTDITGNAATVTNGVYTTGDQTIGGIKTFSSPIVGAITGNAGTVTNGVYTNLFYADPSWLTSLSTSKIDLSTVTAAITPLQVALSTAVYTVGDQTIGGIKTFSSPIVGAITGNAGTVTNGVYTNLFYADPSWLTSLSTSKIDLSTVTAAITPLQVALSTAVYTVGDQTIGGIKTFSSDIAGNITGNAATATTALKATNIAGGSIGQLPYQTAADTTGLLAAGTAGQILQSNGAAAPSWVTNTAGDVSKASTQTFTGLNTFTSTITAKGFANMSQSIVLGSVATFAADGSGVVLMTFNGTGSIATITGCASGAVAQGQPVFFVVSDWLVGGISFADTAPASAAPDALLLDGAAGAWTPDASAVSLGSTITLLCTTVNSNRLWVEVGRSISGS